MMRVVRVLVENSRGILLVKSEKRPYHWELPGGKVKRKEGDDDEAAAARELKEETGLILKQARLLYRRTEMDYPDATRVFLAYTCFVAEATESEETPQALSGEIIAVEWFSVSELSKIALVPSTRRLLIRWCWQRRRGAHS